MDKNKAVAKAILMAQIASDAGKGLNILNHINGDFDEHIKELGYRAKDGFIKKAINIIRSGGTDFNYYVDSGLDQNGNASKIIYFDFKVNGRRQQISFHSFSGWKGYIGSGRKTHWNHDLGGSRMACQLLKKEYNM